MFVKYCYTNDSWLLQHMSWYTLFGLLTARWKIVVKHDYSEHSPNKCTHQVRVGLRDYFFRWWLETTIFSHSVATRGPKFDQRGPKPNQTWIFNRVWIGLCEYFCKIMVGNHHFDPLWFIFYHWRDKIGPISPKSESFLSTHPTSVDSKFELDCVNTFSYNGRKPPVWPT